MEFITSRHVLSQRDLGNAATEFGSHCGQLHLHWRMFVHRGICAVGFLSLGSMRVGRGDHPRCTILWPCLLAVRRDVSRACAVLGTPSVVVAFYRCGRNPGREHRALLQPVAGGDMPTSGYLTRVVLPLLVVGTGLSWLSLLNYRWRRTLASAPIVAIVDCGNVAEPRNRIRLRFGLRNCCR